METRELDASRVEVRKVREKARMVGVTMGQGVWFHEQKQMEKQDSS